jgi:glycosyltransferase involved in cell wall biosynthesis
LKTVLISAYTGCPNTGSEPGNGWNWLMGYRQNGYIIDFVTSDLYVIEIKKFCAENNVEGINFHFASNKLSGLSLKIPFLGDYLHYYLWLIKARPIVKKLTKKTSFAHAHHVTYSSIKFGTPLYNLNTKIILGPLGGGQLPHFSLKKYLGKNYYFEVFKFSVGNFLSNINPTVSWSIKSANCILTSNEIATNIVKKHSSIPLVKMFDAGLSDNFDNKYVERELNGVVNILWIGRMLPRKGLNLAIESIAQLPKDFHFHFYIVGDGPLRKGSEKIVEEHHLQEKITFIGKLPHDLLKHVFLKSHLLLFPSLIDSCPMQVFEAMAYGLPVVTLNHQGMKEQVTEERGIKIEVNEPSNYPALIAEGILRVIKDPTNYDKLSFNAYQFGQEQLWSKRIKKFIEEIVLEL